MKTRKVSFILAGAIISVVAVMALLPQSSRAQPGGNDMPSGDDGGGDPGAQVSSSATVDCAENGSDAHYEEFLA